MELFKNILCFIFVCCRSSEKVGSVKSDRTAGQEEDDYGGSTDEEPEEVQSTPASALSSLRKSSFLLVEISLILN